MDIVHFLDLMQRTLTQHELAKSEGVELAGLIANYARSWTLLQAYDDHTLQEPDSKPETQQIIDEAGALSAIHELKKQLIQCEQATELFGQLRGNQFHQNTRSRMLLVS